ncbi:stalk domain-containing protein [Anaerovorax odorimutans]|uniref:stalk domain-containing protein n=1 Tax=Anaerovorax odorimutans TaxID=109327 RepID=UPI000419AA43|nr:stalk domain-containing protein [Anaerovorax odorimutans]
MKRNIKGFILGFVAASLMIVPMFAYADTIQVILNSVNINLNGTQVAEKGQSYTLENGNSTPYSLNYNGSVYLPIRKVSELIGKDITYDGKTTTITITDKKTEDTVTQKEETEKKDNTNNNEESNKDSSKDSSNTDTKSDKNDSSQDSSKTVSDTDVKSGFLVINSFYKVKDNKDTVNKPEGYLDGKEFTMLTSKQDLINFSDTVQALYKIKYSDKITEMSLVSPEKEDTVKEISYTGTSIIGSNGTYELDPYVLCYEFNDSKDIEYEVSKIHHLKKGNKVYLYETNGKDGYDIVLMDLTEKE